MKPLTREVLDGMPCGGCGKEIGDPEQHSAHDMRRWLHGRCHMSAGTRVSYLDGVLTVACRECKKLIVEIAVAP